MASKHLQIILLLFVLLQVEAFFSEARSRQLDRGEPPGKVLFDDFAYDSTHLGQAGSLFGQNAWIIADKRTENSRMWFRYNHDEHPVNPSAHISTTNQDSLSVLVISLDQGYKRDTLYVQREPMIRSGTETLQGTYATRIRFSNIPINAPRMMGAFWTQVDEELFDKSLIGRHEMDFEWNNWFKQREGTHAATMHVTNHAWSKGSGHTNVVHCSQKSILTNRLASECIDTNNLSLIDHQHPIQKIDNAWWILHIVHDGAKVTYQMHLDHPSTPTWKGGDKSGNPIVINSSVPTAPMNIMYGWILKDDAPRLPESVYMEIDWFYYSPIPHLAPEFILEDIQTRLRPLGPRINTTNLSLTGAIHDQ